MGGGEVGTPRGLARSSSGVWWKLGDAAAASDASSEVERRLRGIAEEEAAVRARVERRHAAAPAVRRRIAAASMGLEAVALVYGLWTAARRRGNSSRRLKLLHLLPALAVPAMATLVLAAFARFRRTCKIFILIYVCESLCCIDLCGDGCACSGWAGPAAS